MNKDSQFNPIDMAFAHFLSQRTTLPPHSKEEFKSLCAKLSMHQALGHSCIYITQDEQALVLASGLASECNLTPLILEHNRLYLHRYWHYEDRLSQQLNALCKHSPSTLKLNNIDNILNRYFIDLIDETDWQRVAAKTAISNYFCIITGGPGTGKTSTVVKILAILQELSTKTADPLHIALTAPTGKAAMRLQESINNSKDTLPCPESVKQLIPDTVFTLHRLLGSKPPSPHFKHHSKHPLAYDLIVADEASMIDLALMSKLVDALKPNARLIILGDKNQLASVESGSVLADLTAALPEQTVELKKSYRFQGKIKQLADSINNQANEQAWQILQENHPNTSLLEDKLEQYATEKYSAYLQLIKDKAKINDIFSAFNRFQILCSNRHGEHGVIEINKLIEKSLHLQNLIQLSGQWYIGRPIMVTKNNTEMQLYNGDFGICLVDDESKKLCVFFQRPDGKIKKILPARAPAHETAFAMTIHKSQGSEFDECLCILPDKPNPVLSKELIYTAITRAKTKLKVLSNQAIFYQALNQKVDRHSGLYEKLTAKSVT